MYRSGTVYLAGRFEDQARLRGWRDVLQTVGVRVTSRWLDEPAVGPDYADALFPDIAKYDLDDLDAADAFVLLNDTRVHGTGRGGRHVETGYAYAKLKPIFLVGARENVFHWLPWVQVLPNLWALVQRFQEMGVATIPASPVPSSTEVST